MQPPEAVGFVINYYSRPSFSPAHRTATTLCIQLLKENQGVDEIILVDGSQQPDLLIKEICDRENIGYLHLGRELTFAEGLNAGWKSLKQPYIGLSANDIFAPEDTIRTLLEVIKLPDVGCVFPYLSYCDYPGQSYSVVRKPITCEPSTMTLNVNIFKREVLEKIQGIDENFSGSYNDYVLMMGIRELGYRVVLVGNTRVFHLGRMTISKGSTYNWVKDMQIFKERYGEYSAKHGKFFITRWKWPLATTKLAAQLWWLCQNSSSKLMRYTLQKFVIWVEPELTRFPAKFGKSSGKR